MLKTTMETSHMGVERGLGSTMFSSPKDELVGFMIYAVA